MKESHKASDNGSFDADELQIRADLSLDGVDRVDARLRHHRPSDRTGAAEEGWKRLQ